MSPFFLLLFPAGIELENRVARLPEVVAELGVEGKLDLAVARELNNELVYVRSRGRTAEEWLPLLAEAVGAEWEQDGKTRRLVRSPVLKRRMEAEELRERAALWQENARTSIGDPDLSPLDEDETRKVIAKAVELKKAAGARQAGAGARLIAAQTDLIPSWRFMRRFLTPAVTTQLAATPLGEVGYWSTAKRPLRQSLSVSRSLFDTFNREHGLLVQTLSEGKDEAGFRRAVADTSDYLNLRRDAGPAVEAMVRVERFNPSVVAINVQLLDAQGGAVEQYGPSISLTVGKSTWPGYATLDTPKFTASPVLQELVSGLDRESEEGKAFRKRALDPVVYEPGDLYLRPVLDAACKRSETDAVIGLPDGAIPVTLSTLGRDLKLAPPILNLEGQVKWRVEPDLVVGHPRYPLEATQTRLDRATFRDLLTRLNKGEAGRLDTFAEYAVRQNPDAGGSELERLIFSASEAIHPNNALVELLLGEIVGFRDTLRLYGQMTPSQRSALWAEEPVRVAQLPPAAQQTLTRRVFRRDIYLQSQDSTSLPDRDAPTWLPGGIPAETVLQARNQASPGVILTEGPQKGYAMGLESFANALAYQRSGEATPYGDLQRIRMIPVTLGLLTLKIRFSPQASAETNVIDLPPLAASGLPYADFPADFRRKIEERVEVFRKQRAATKAPGAVPPP